MTSKNIMINEIKSLQELIDVVDSAFKCDENVFWKHKFLPKEKWNVEINYHSSRHLTKSAGKLAALCESVEYGAPFGKETAKNITFSALATIFKNASILGLTAADLFEQVPKKLKYNPNK